MPTGVYKRTKEHLQKLKERSPFQKGCKPYKYWLGKKRPASVGLAITKSNKERTGEQSRNWKDGRTFDKKKYRVMLREKQAGRKKPEQCELCGAIGKIVFDHDHKTGKFRGWICYRCNLTLGLVRDNTELLDEMIKYLLNSRK